MTTRWPTKDGGRTDCARWFAQEYPGRTLSRSACVGCPFRSAGEWVAVSKSDPDLFCGCLRVGREIAGNDADQAGAAGAWSGVPAPEPQAADAGGRA